MPTAIRPVDHEDRLSLIEHLSELRSRLIFSALALVVSFSFCFWQNHAIFDLINKPLDKSQNTNSTKHTQDPLEQAGRFQIRLGKALESTAPALRQTRDSLAHLSRSNRLSASDRAALRAPLDQLDKAARDLAVAAKAVPTDTKRKPVTLSPTEPFTTTISVSLYAGILLALPLLLYQLYAFILPAFTPSERRIALPLMYMVPFLFVAGVFFAYFIVLPRSLNFLTNFNDENFDILLQAKTYYTFAILILGGTGLLFEIPVAVLAATRIAGITTRQLRAWRGYVILGISIAAAVATPTPDPLTMTVVMAPLVLLYELSILLAAWLNRVRPPRSIEDEDEEDHVDVPDPIEHSEEDPDAL